MKGMFTCVFHHHRCEKAMRNKLYSPALLILVKVCGFGNRNNPIAGGSDVMCFKNIRPHLPASTNPQSLHLFHQLKICVHGEIAK